MAHGGGGLSEPVRPSFALFVAGGIPGQVVVHDCIEVVLQIDAFGEAVGGYKHGRDAFVEFSKRLHLFLALVEVSSPVITATCAFLAGKACFNCAPT